MQSTKDVISYSSNHGPHSLQRIDYLDGWRGLAIIVVLYGHFVGFPYLSNGMLGVDIFFVLSGMLMSRILFINRQPLKLFYKRRLSRILPVFILYTISAFIIASVLDVKFQNSELISTLLFLRTYFPDNLGIWDSKVAIEHIWSLNVEEHSYIIMSLFVLSSFLVKKAWVPLFIVGLLSQLILIYYIKHPELNISNYEIRTECQLSFIFYAAGYNLIKQNFICFVKPWMPPLFFILAVFCYTIYAPWWFMFFEPILLALTINHLSESSKIFIKILSFKPLQLFGIWSYSIYLWQQPFYLNQEYFPPYTALLMSLLIGLGSFYYFENPIRRWLNKRMK